MCDLGLELANSPIVRRIDRLYDELASRGIRFRPHCWLGDEWFSPDDVPGIAIPFYLAHPRLASLERKQMLEVEGGNERWCMRILRHEAGHAIDTAYQLYRRKGYRQVFGDYRAPYPDYYRPRPQSKRFVQHLEPWYAQSHPAEDFAETFAVWLTPGSHWETIYEGWHAKKKIEYVNKLMTNLAKIKRRSRAKIEPVNRLTKTLREHYQQRHQRYSIDCPTGFDRDLKKLFSERKVRPKQKTAAVFLVRHQMDLCSVVSHWTGEYRYNVNQVLREMIERCRALKLYVPIDESEVKFNAAVMLSVHTMNYLHGGMHHIAL